MARENFPSLLSYLCKWSFSFLVRQIPPLPPPAIPLSKKRACVNFGKPSPPPPPPSSHGASLLAPQRKGREGRAPPAWEGGGGVGFIEWPPRSKKVLTDPTHLGVKPLKCVQGKTCLLRVISRNRPPVCPDIHARPLPSPPLPSLLVRAEKCLLCVSPPAAQRKRGKGRANRHPLR